VMCHVEIMLSSYKITLKIAKFIWLLKWYKMLIITNIVETTENAIWMS